MKTDRIVALIITIFSLTLAVSFLNINTATGTTLAKPAPKILARVKITDHIQLEEFLALHLDIATANKKEQYFIIVTDQKEIALLEEEGFSPEIIIPDIGKKVGTTAGASDFGSYHNYAETVAALNTIHSDHPEITKTPQVIGYSYENREIYAIKISDNPDLDETEPEVLYTGLHHAREPITIEVLLYFINYLTDNYGTNNTVTNLVNERELWFVPIINPDGYVYNETYSSRMWRKNRQDNGDGTYGVDLNRNYSYQWGYDNNGSSSNTSDSDYRGTAAFSEPETQAIRDFCESHEFVLALNYHAYGNMFLYPWGYEDSYTPDHNTMVAISVRMTNANNYDYGTGWELLYNTNGEADDWMYGEQGTKDKIYSFTPEVGSGSDYFWPDEDRITPLCQENLGPNLFFASIADNPDAITSPTAVYLAEGDTSGNLETWISIMNPNSTPAACQLTFMETNSDITIENIFVAATARETIYLNDYVANAAAATKIECANGQTVIGERAMYWSAEGITRAGGHCSLGATAPSTTWYLAEGYTGDSFDTWIIIMNPNNTAAECKATFMKDNGSTVIVEDISIAATSKENLHVNDYVSGENVATKIECTNGQTVVVERSMYWDSAGINAVAGHCSLGTTTPNNTWFLPEGYTGDSFDTWISIMNPNNSIAECEVTFMKADGSTVIAEDVSISPLTRETLSVNSYAPDENVATKIECTNGQTVVAERIVYWNSAGMHWSGGHCSIGTTTLNNTWYLAEGYTGGSFDTWIIIMNPNATTAECKLTFMKSDGTTVTHNVNIDGTTRHTLLANFYVPNESIATKVESTNGVTIAVDSAVYWDSNGNEWIGGHCRHGAT